jgi:hypothetical protein
MRTLVAILSLLVAGLLAAPATAQTLSLEHDPVLWPQPDVWLVRGEGYRDRWVTITIYQADGRLFNWGPWSPGRSNTLNKPFPGFTSGAGYVIEVRRGYQYTPGTGRLLALGVFSIP